MENIIWAKVGFGDYEVSNNGLVRNGEGFILSHAFSEGYPIVKLSLRCKRKTIRIHRLVAIAFVENPNNYLTVNHKDGNKLNNNSENLEWCTQKQNIQHAIRTGLKVFRTGRDSKITAWVQCLCTGRILTHEEAALEIGIPKNSLGFMVSDKRENWTYFVRTNNSPLIRGLLK